VKKITATCAACVSVSVLFGFACDNPEKAPAPRSTATAPVTANTAVLMATPPPAETVAAPATKATATAAAGVSAAPSATAKASASASATAKTVASVSAAASATSAPAKPVYARVSGSHFTVDLSVPGDCAAGQRCNGSLTLRATEGYHINKEYPYKLTMNDSAGVTFLGKEGKTFSKASGDFTQSGELTGTTNFAFQAASAGAAKLTGVFKMSVCSEANCQIEVQTVAIDVPVR
jgi:hypothetical protein